MLKKSPDWRTWPVQLGAQNSHIDTILIPEPTKQTPEFQLASGLQQILFTGAVRNEGRSLEIACPATFPSLQVTARQTQGIKVVAKSAQCGEAAARTREFHLYREAKGRAEAVPANTHAHIDTCAHTHTHAHT